MKLLKHIHELEELGVGERRLLINVYTDNLDNDMRLAYLYYWKKNKNTRIKHRIFHKTNAIKLTANLFGTNYTRVEGAFKRLKRKRIYDRVIVAGFKKILEEESK